MTALVDEIRAVLDAATPGPWCHSTTVGAQVSQVRAPHRHVANCPLTADARLIAAAPDLLRRAAAELGRLRHVQSSLRDWAQGRVETLTRCISTEGVAPSTAAEMMYERTIMRDIVAMLDEATP